MVAKAPTRPTKANRVSAKRNPPIDSRQSKASSEPKATELYPKDKFDRLCRAMEWSRAKMEPFRRHVRECVTEFVGDRYGDGACGEARAFNMMRMAVTIHRRQVAARVPQVSIIAHDPQYAPIADDFQIEVNCILEEMGYGTSLNEVVMQALFGLGVMKHGLAAGGEKIANAQGTLHDPGMAFADPVDLDDFVLDMGAKRFDRLQYAADRYTMSVEACEAKGYDLSNARPRTRTSNEDGDEKTSSLQTGSDAAIFNDGYIESVELWDVWLPFEKKVLVVQADENGGFGAGCKVLAVIDWKQREAGPYHYLWFEKPPSNLMPTAPAQGWYHMNRTINGIVNKVTNQAKRQKDLTLYRGEAKEDAQEIVDSNDGETLEVEDIDGVKPYRSGGVDPNNIEVLMTFKGLFSYNANNMDSQGGLERQANTVGQEQIISQANSALGADMQDHTTAFATSSLRHIAELSWDNPAPAKKRRKQIPDSSLTIPIEFTMNRRKGALTDYRYEIAPYSMQSRTPAERMAAISQIMIQFVIPLMEALKAQGKTVDIGEFMDIASTLTNLPELKRIIKDMTPREIEEMMKLAQDMGSSGERPKQSPVTTRTNVRENVRSLPGPASTEEGLKRARSMEQNTEGAQA